jgi:hypothetical protein
MSHFGLTAKRLITSRAAIEFSSRIVNLPCSRVSTNPFSCDVVNVEKILELLLMRQLRLCGHGRQEWFGRRIVFAHCENRDHFLFRITKRCELASKNTPCIDIDRSIESLRLGDGSVSVNHHRTTAIFGCPVVTNGQTVFIGFTCRLSKEGE